MQSMARYGVTVGHMSVLVVGGGIGGLTAALALHARGIAVDRARAGREHPRARRRHQHAAARDPRARDLGLLAALDARRDADRTSSSTSTASASRSGASRAAWTPGTPCRNSRSTAACSRASSTRAVLERLGPERSAPAPPHRHRAGRRGRHGRVSPTATAGRVAMRAATCWSAPTASTRSSARRCSPARVRRAGTAACSGAAPADWPRLPRRPLDDRSRAGWRQARRLPHRARRDPGRRR